MTLTEMQQEIDRLTLENQYLRTCPIFGIQTRASLELNWKSMDWQKVAIVFCDIDNLKELNGDLGYEVVNDRIRQALSVARRSEVLQHRWFSGDEVVLITPTEEAAIVAARIQDALQKQGMSATFAIVPCLCSDLSENVANAEFLVSKSKAIGRKSLIISVL